MQIVGFLPAPHSINFVVNQMQILWFGLAIHNIFCFSFYPGVGRQLQFAAAIVAH